MIEGDTTQSESDLVVGKRLRALRPANGSSLRACRRPGVTSSAPSRIENEERGFRWTLTLRNLGPGTAADPLVLAPWPTELGWSSDSCGAGPPREGALAWRPPPLPAGATAECTVELSVARQHKRGIQLEARACAASPDFHPARSWTLAEISANQPIGGSQ